MFLSAQAAEFERDDFGQGDWSKFTLYQSGSFSPENCMLCPHTCAVVTKHVAVYSQV